MKKPSISPFPASLALASLCACSTTPRPGQAPPQAPNGWTAGELHILDQDGAWCWFEGERAQLAGDRLILGTVSAGHRDPDRKGDINVLVHDWSANTTRVVELHDQLERDDHNSPSLTWLPDGRLLTIYAKHGSDSVMRWRTSTGPALVDWSKEQTQTMDTRGRGLTYSNTYYLGGAEEPVLVNFFRGLGWNPNLTTSTDLGKSWSEPAPLLLGPDRPYVRYVSNGADTVHFAVSEAHPRAMDTGIRHGTLTLPKVMDSLGQTIGVLGEKPAMVAHLTQVTVGRPDRVAWCNDIRLDRDQNPVIAYSVQRDSANLPQGQGGEDCRYRYAHLKDGTWQDHPVAHAGQRLYAGEDDYTGLIVIDPSDTSRVVFSTNADPVSGGPLVSDADGLRHYELFEGRTPDGGATWSFRPLTQNSPVDNLRPVFPVGAQDRVVVAWMRGTYTTYQNFDTQVVAMALDQ